MRRIAPVFIAVFLTAQVATCACREAMARAQEEKPRKRSCCTKQDAPPVKSESKSCCCSDGSHLAVEHRAEPPSPASSSFAALSALSPVLPTTSASRPSLPAETGPPFRATGVLLFTLHSTLQI